MRRFLFGQRVRISDRSSPLYRHTGKVVRMRKADEGAWVEMDGDLPEELRGFPVADERARHVLLYPEDCGPVRQEGAR